MRGVIVQVKTIKNDMPIFVSCLLPTRPMHQNSFLFKERRYTLLKIFLFSKNLSSDLDNSPLESFNSVSLIEVI